MSDTYCSMMIADLRANGFTWKRIAQEMNVSIRQVCKYAKGVNPCGVRAILLYKFHVKHGTKGQCPEGHLAERTS